MSIDFTKAKQWIAAGYPLQTITTRQQLQEASDLLDNVEQFSAADSTADVDRNAIDELRGDVVYAGERHWTFQWKIIAGAIISVLLLYWWSGSKDDDIVKQQSVVENIKAWQETDTVIPLEKFNTASTNYDIYSEMFNSASKYKAAKLQDIGNRYYGIQKAIDSYLQTANITSDPEKKAKALKSAEDLKAKMPAEQKELSEQYTAFASKSFKEIQSMALEESTKKLNVHKGDGRSIKFWLWFLAICIPLYIFACRPYGYSINRYTTEAATLNLIHRIGLWVSGALVTGAAALQFTTIITKWSNGTTSESDDGTGPAVAAAKFFLLVAAVIVFCFVSCFIMAYATIAGLIRNYDWAAIFAKAKSKTQKA